MRRRTFITGLGGAVATWPLTTRAQQKPTVVVGYLASTIEAESGVQLVGIRQGLAETGYLEGQNLGIELRSAKGAYDRLPGLAAELVAAKVDLIIAQAPPAAQAAKAATSTIPIVFGVGSDPVASGLVASLARPGGNLTGVTLLNSDLMAKRFDLMSELVPKATRFALLVNPNTPNPWIGGVQDAAAKMGVQLQILKAATPDEIDAAFATMVQLRTEALVIGEDVFLATRFHIAELALRHSLPTIGLLRQFSEIGGLVSYGTNLKDAYRQIGVYAGQILKGANPADLPVQRPTKFELVLNLKTAKALGLAVPPLLLAQADEMIE